MCQLFGFSGKEHTDISDILKVFYGESKTNPHGWGLACYEEPGRFIAREPIRASNSRYLRYILKSRVVANLAIGHIRYATHGKHTMNNTHPFTKVIKGTEWVFAHNGILDDTRIPKKRNWKPRGETDSELAFCLLADAIDRNGANASSILGVIRKLEPLGKLNLLFTSGRCLYAYHNGGELHCCSRPEGYYVTTKPLNGWEWEPFPCNRLIRVGGGKETYRSGLAS